MKVAYYLFGNVLPLGTLLLFLYARYGVRIM